ncbi:MAG: HPF/RaiA family ribosome-associated protein [Bacteroides sp.]|nr:HPF/RaiA family ribosome-associated protein [Bacteroides sp.]MCM1379002.1 HPF/RaiA family ribosome-associated protein [Bacteroides sp.]MCM1445618.1 HPF/RaiA family ribosome-associated protein [Prevotella sp.]
METKIQAIHFESSQALEDFVNKKIDKLIRKNPGATEAAVNLRLIKPETAMNKEAIVRIYMPQREEVVATKVADTFEEAVDLAIAAIEPQLEKYKTKK